RRMPIGCSRSCAANSPAPRRESMSGWWTSARRAPRSSSPADTMRFKSTRDEQLTAGFGEALAQGLAPDGGLYVPTEWPRLEAGALTARESLDGIGAKLIAPFAAGDALGPSLPEITSEAFDFPAPVVALGGDGRLAVLELFHGPTAAFKDFGARFLAACL